MKKIITTFLVLCCTIHSYAAKADKAVDVTVNGETRQYWLYVPSNAKKNCPMVMTLHGASGNMEWNPLRFKEIADKEGFIVAFPQGKLINFPVFGGTVTGWDASGEMNEDVEFLKAVIEDVASKYTIDRNRLYCCGFSNGGMMTYAMSNTCSDIFAAFASISGFPLNEFHFHHTGTRPVPFLHIHGKQDNFVRYDLMPVIVDEMVARLGANPVPEKINVSGKYDKSIYEATEGSFPYIYYEVDAMGHNDFTEDTEDGNSSQTMWNFMKQYTLDTPCDTTLKWMPRIETEGYSPKQHGWTVKSGSILLRFGGDQNTEGKQNVYRSLQLTTGIYKLCFKTAGSLEKNISVKLQKLTGKKNYLLRDSVKVGQETVLPFIVSDGWGEYKLSFSGKSASDEITISDIRIYSATEEELSNVQTPLCTTTEDTCLYSLSGIKHESTQLNKGIYIKNRKKLLLP